MSSEFGNDDQQSAHGEQSRMPLSDARIDIEGNLIVEGTLAFPPDREGFFDLPEHELLQLSMFPGMNKLSVVKAVRDLETGFFTSEAIGPALLLPAGLASTLRDVLRRPPLDPVELSLTDHHGRLSTDSTSSPQKSQKLSDWRLSTTTKDGAVQCTLSAALVSVNLPADHHARDPIPQFWESSSESPPQVVAMFAVDALTRVVSMGGVEKSLYPSEDVCVEVDRQTKSVLDLGGANIGYVNSVYGLYTKQPTGEARWACISLLPDGRTLRTLTITSFAEVQRASNGFIVSQTASAETAPRVRLHGVSFDHVAGFLDRRKEFSVRMEGTEIGQLSSPHSGLRHFSGEPNLDRWITEAHLTFRLDPHGLATAFRLKTEAMEPTQDADPFWYEGEFNISWDILIVRIPAIAARRAFFLRVFEDLN